MGCVRRRRVWGVGGSERRRPLAGRGRIIGAVAGLQRLWQDYRGSQPPDPTLLLATPKLTSTAASTAGWAAIAIG